VIEMALAHVISDKTEAAYVQHITAGESEQAVKEVGQ
jgi:stage V sporulation protein SpoVS